LRWKFLQMAGVGELSELVQQCCGALQLGGARMGESVLDHRSVVCEFGLLAD
jgi:hypothetical protein